MSDHQQEVFLHLHHFKEVQCMLNQQTSEKEELQLEILNKEEILMINKVKLKEANSIKQPNSILNIQKGLKFQVVAKKNLFF